MAQNLLVIIDMINGFAKEGALADPKINKITPAIVKEIKLAQKAGYPIVFLKDEHSKNDPEFKTYPPHCIKGTEESKIISEFKPYLKSFRIIPKQTTNGFATADFLQIVETMKFDNVIVCGCCTDICIYEFASALHTYLEKHHLATKIIVHEDEVATFDSPVHKARREHQVALIKMQAMGVVVVKEGEDYE